MYRVLFLESTSLQKTQGKPQKPLQYESLDFAKDIVCFSMCLIVVYVFNENMIDDLPCISCDTHICILALAHYAYSSRDFLSILEKY